MMPAASFRKFALSLPEAKERETWGHPTFRVRDKIFASLSADGTTAGIKATPEEQDILIKLHPQTFTIAEYTGRYGWVSTNLATADPDHIRELLVTAWKRTAPKRLAKAYNSSL